MHDPATIKVHPLADLFPMLSDDELKELAADIKANEATSPRGGRGKKDETETANLVGGFSSERLRQARLVLRYYPELVQPVVAGIRPLNDAYDLARARKVEAESDEAKLAKLREEAPDLAKRVGPDPSDLKLADAMRQFEQREADENLLKEIEESAPDLVEMARAGKLTARQAVAAVSERDREAQESHDSAASWIGRLVALIDGKSDGADLLRGFSKARVTQDELAEFKRLSVCHRRLVNAIAAVEREWS